MAGGGLFVCPPEHGARGRITGLCMARDLLVRLRDDQDRQRGVLLVPDRMRDAGAAMDLSAHDPSASSAAYASMGIMAELVSFAARRADIECLTRKALTRAERDCAFVDEYMRQKRQAFVERVASARARKRLARSQGGAA